MSSITQPVDLTVISQTLPVLDPNTQVPRENFLDTIDTIFESGVKAVVLEGAGGIGKTTLAAQYSLRHRNHTFSLFIKSSNRWGYDPEVLRQDLCTQLHWLLFGSDDMAGAPSGDALLRELLFNFRKKVRRENAHYRFVIDGLDEIPERDVAQKDLILDLLPLDFDKCYFLFSSSGKGEFALPISLSQKSYPLTAFSLDETRRYLTPLIADANRIAEIHTICRGLPGNLASVRRSILGGQTAEEIVVRLHETVGPIIENEWRVVDLGHGGVDGGDRVLGIMLFSF